MGGQVSSCSDSSEATHVPLSPVPTHDQEPGKVKQEETFVLGFEDLGEEQRKGAGTAIWLVQTDKGFRDIFGDQMRKCVEESQANGEKMEDVAKKCVNARALMSKCLEANPDYCRPLLKAERDALDEVLLEGGAANASAAAIITKTFSEANEKTESDQGRNDVLEKEVTDRV